MKKKILTLLLGCVMCMSVIAIGAYALTQVNLGINGTLSFIAYDKQVYIEDITIKNFVEETTKGYKSTDKTYEDYHGVYLKNSNATVDLSGKVLQGETLEIDITMVNLKSNYLKTSLSYEDLPADVLIRSTGLYMPQNTGTRVESGQSKMLKIYISNLSTTLTALDLSTINLSVTFEELESLIHEGTRTEGEESLAYYYVEMGTLPGVADENGLATEEYLKWRYISSDGDSAYAGDMPTNTLGYYILESAVPAYSSPIRNDGKTLGNVAFNNNYTDTVGGEYYYNEFSNVYANDYAFSNLRKYINGERVYSCNSSTFSNSHYTYLPLTTSHYSSMFDDFCMDPENDLIYNRIIARTLTDLYSDIEMDGTKIDDTTHFAPSNYNNMGESDKFWVLSYDELLNMFC
ncbi:MAG: hypothetical protein IJA69_03670, partial [Clostridia bacterium]|nr:hypothetical protein [Clostridia bacterium]